MSDNNKQGVGKVADQLRRASAERDQLRDEVERLTELCEAQHRELSDLQPMTVHLRLLQRRAEEAEAAAVVCRQELERAAQSRHSNSTNAHHHQSPTFRACIVDECKGYAAALASDAGRKAAERLRLADEMAVALEECWQHGHDELWMVPVCDALRKYKEASHAK